ncbi:MAG: hypothetical protein KFH87_01875, partial [Bacteroidetes bacterium]|nr:hypothetical protein [Bacteroidota bacterium]
RRAKPFESWERKRTARIYRNARNFTLHPDPARATEDVVRYTYMDPLYAIGSIPGGLVQPREQHSWDVTWISDHPEEPATFFLMHPYSDPEALRPFMPHSADLALRNTGLHDPYFGTVTKIVGGSPFEDVFQYKNTLIALYDIGEISRFPVITGFMPLDLQSLDIDSTETQWITINTGDVYIGMYPLAPCRIIDGSIGRHYFSSHKRNGVIIHVAGRNVAGSYEQFRKRLRGTVVDTSRFAADLHVRYTTPDGDKLVFTYGGERSVNDRTPSMQDELLFDSPLLHSRRGSGILTLRGRSGDVVLDMKAREIREET